MPDTDPYAAIAKPIAAPPASGGDDPYAAIAKPVKQDPYAAIAVDVTPQEMSSHKAATAARATTPTAPKKAEPLSLSQRLVSDEGAGKLIGHIGKAWQTINTPVVDLFTKAGVTQEWLTKKITGHTQAEIEDILDHPEKYNKTELGLAAIENARKLYGVNSSQYRDAIKKASEPNEWLVDQNGKIERGHAEGLSQAQMFWLGFFGAKDSSVAETASSFTSPVALAMEAAGGVLKSLNMQSLKATEAATESLNALNEAKLTGNPEFIAQAQKDVDATRAAVSQLEKWTRSTQAILGGAGATFTANAASQVVEGVQEFKKAKTPQERAAAKSKILQGVGFATIGAAGVGGAEETKSGEVQPEAKATEPGTKLDTSPATPHQEPNAKLDTAPEKSDTEKALDVLLHRENLHGEKTPTDITATELAKNDKEMSDYLKKKGRSVTDSKEATDLLARYAASDPEAKAIHERRLKLTGKTIGSKSEPVVPEKPATIKAQMAALKAGTIKVVMIPEGGEVPVKPAGMSVVKIKQGPGAGTYIFDPKQIKAEEVIGKASAGRHGELLGHVQSKAEVQEHAQETGKHPVAVVAKDANGNEVHSSAVANDAQKIAEQKKVTSERHPEAKVTVETPESVIKERRSPDKTKMRERIDAMQFGISEMQRHIDDPETSESDREALEKNVAQHREMLDELRTQARAANVAVPKSDHVAKPVHAETESKAGDVAKVPTNDLVVDAKRFQYKQNTDEAGATNLLKGRVWNKDLAGVVSVWRDPVDGKTYVVNGHHRVALARENNVPNLNVQYIDAPDAATARVKGALQNIAEGRGTAVDAAKFFRDAKMSVEDLRENGITLTEAVADSGVALSKLSDHLFDEVAMGRMRVNRGVAIGKASDVPENQEAIVQLIKQAEARGKTVTDATIEELGRMANSAPQHTETQENLFGVQEMTKNLALEKAEISEYIKKQIAQEKRAFSSVANQGQADRLSRGGNKIKVSKNAKIAQEAEQAAELYEKLSVRAGEVDNALNRAAEELAKGDNPNAVKERAYEAVRTALSEALKGTEGKGNRGRKANDEGGKGVRGEKPGEVEAAQAIVPAESQSLQPAESFSVEVHENFPMSKGTRESLARASANEELRRQFERVGITSIEVEPPHSFPLSGQGDIHRYTGELRINSAATDAENTIAHELCHDIFNRLGPEATNVLEHYLEDHPEIESQHAGGLEEKIADHFADVIQGKATIPEDVRKAFFESPLLDRPKKDAVAELEEHREAPSAEIVLAGDRQSWQSIGEQGGTLRDTDEVAAIVAKHGDFPLIVKDVNGFRHVMPASMFAELMKTPANGFVREAWLAANGVFSPFGSIEYLEKSIADHEAMLKANRYLSHKPGAAPQEVDPNRVIEPHVRKVFETALADERAELAVRKSGVKQKVTPTTDLDKVIIDKTSGATEFVQLAERVQKKLAEAKQAEKPAELPAPKETSPDTEVLHKFSNEKDGTESEVARNRRTGKFSVILRDVDSGESLPNAYQYDTEEKAIAKAREIANVKEEAVHAETKPGESPALPGMEQATEDQQRAAQEHREGEQSSEMQQRLNSPMGSVERSAGEMERESPLFQGTDASPQQDMFKAEREAAEAEKVEREKTEKESQDAFDRAQKLGDQLYSGFGDPNLFRRLFPNVARTFREWASDTPTQESEQRATMRETRGGMDREEARAAEFLEKIKNQWTRRPHGDSIKFWNAAEGVTDVKTLSPEDQKLAAIFKELFEHDRKAVQALRPELLEDFIENYFPHIWDLRAKDKVETNWIKEKLHKLTHRGESEFPEMAARRPFAGSGSFLRKRTIPTMADGIAEGLIPKSWNPVDMALLKHHEVQKFIMAHKTLDMMKENGLAKFYRVKSEVPDGWTKLDDRLGTVYGREKNEDGVEFTIIRGGYYAPKDVARVFNNYVSRGLSGRSAIYDTIRNTNDRLNAFQLGISAFHATTTAFNAAVSEVGLGVQQLYEATGPDMTLANRAQKVKQGLTHVAIGTAIPVSAVRTAVNGHMLLREWLSKDSYAKMSEEAKAVELAGGRLRMNTIEIRPWENLMNRYADLGHDIATGELKSAAKKLPGWGWQHIGGILDKTSRGVMEGMVPRMKAGAFYDMAHNILDDAAREGWSKEKTRARMQKAWDSIDNRFGQVVYENLFWNNAMKDVLQAGTRSVGWNLGSLREGVGGVKDTATQALGALSGKRPEFTDRMAFTYSAVVVYGLAGAVLTRFWTGKNPKELYDYYFPPDSAGIRHSIPGYSKDYFAFTRDPLGTTLNKMSPICELTTEMLQNRDFYSEEIRHKDDPNVRQAEQFSKWAIKTAVTPFSVSGPIRMLKQRGADTSTMRAVLKAMAKHPEDVALGQFGFNPAPNWVQNSRAVNKAIEYTTASHPHGTRTDEEARRTDREHEVTEMWREAYKKAKEQSTEGHTRYPSEFIDQTQLAKYKEFLTPEQMVYARKDATEDPIIPHARGLSLEQLVYVYEEALKDEGNDSERKALQGMLRNKAWKVKEIDDKARRAVIRGKLVEYGFLNQEE